MRYIVAGFLVLSLLLSACGKIKARAERVVPQTLSGIKTIELKNITDPLLLQGTDAGVVPEFVITALKTKGYSSCIAPCVSDATATLNVLEYYGGQSINHMVGVAHDKSKIVFTFQIHGKDGALLMNLKVAKDESMGQRDLTVRAVQTLATYIPKAE